MNERPLVFWICKTYTSFISISQGARVTSSQTLRFGIELPSFPCDVLGSFRLCELDSLSNFVTSQHRCVMERWSADKA